MIVVTPLVLTIIGYRSSEDTNENRKLQMALHLAGSHCNRWPKQIDSWLNDSISFRANLIGYYKMIWERGFKASVGGRLQGKNGEFFAIYEGEPEVLRFLGGRPLPHKRIRDTKYAIASTQALCQLHDVSYMCFYIPDKSELYQSDIASYLSPSSGLSFAQQRGDSWREQMLKELEGTTLNFYDLYPLLSERMKDGRVYNRKFDTNHWNARGLMIGYEFIRNIMINQRPEALTSSRNNADLKFYKKRFEMKRLFILDLLIKKISKLSIVVFRN
jgi:hypothetical protein